MSERNDDIGELEQAIKWNRGVRLFGGAITCDLPANFEDVRSVYPLRE